MTTRELKRLLDIKAEDRDPEQAAELRRELRRRHEAEQAYVNAVIDR